MSRSIGVAAMACWVLAAGAASGQAVQQGRGEPKLPPDKKVDAPVHFFLVKDDTGQCTVIKYDGVASTKVHSHVRWDLENECGGTRKISFRNFRKLDESAADCASGGGTPGPPGDGALEDSFRLKGKIRLKLSDASPGRWCFDVHLDDSDKPIDPMIRIDR